MNIPLPPKIAESEAHSRSLRNGLILKNLKVIRAAAIVLVIIATFAASVAAADLLAPTALAVTFALVLAPVSHALERLRIPAGVAAVVTVAATVFALTAGAAALAPEAANWLNDAPRMAQNIERKLRPLTRQIAAVERASDQIAQVGGAGAPQRSVTVTDGGFLMAAARNAPGAVEKGIYVSVLTIFLLAYRRRYTRQFVLLPRRVCNRLRMARIARDVRSRVSGYLFTLSLINIGLALVTAACFYAAHISDALLWGIAFGLLNYIPIIGPTSVIVVAAIFGFATAKTIAGALVPPAILLVLNTIEANLVQPWLLSRRIVINPIAIFLTVVTLVWMWGPAVAITAVPSLIFFHTVALHVPALRPVAFLLATEDRRSLKRRRVI